MDVGVKVWQEMLAENIQYVARVPAAIVTVLVGYVVLRLVQAMVNRAATVAGVQAAIRSMVSSAIGFVGWILIVAAALGVMNLSQLSLAIGGSVALVAMALATGLNNITQDVLAGIFLLSDRRFRLGSRVRAAGVEGTVEALTIRKTLIRDDDGCLHTVPNRNIDSATYVILEQNGDEAARPKAG